MGDNQLQQQLDMEQRERRAFEIAARLHMATLDGYFTQDEFEDALYFMGVTNNWKKERKVA